MLRIAGGRVYDPANGIAGEVRDVCVQDGRIVADVPGARAAASTRAGWSSCRAGSTSTPTSPGRRSTPRASSCPRSIAPTSSSAPRSPAGHRRHRPLDVRHGLPLRAARLHDRRRGRHAAARGPPHARRAARHAGHRRRSSSCSWATTCRSSSSSAPSRRACARRSPGGCRPTGGYGVKLVNPGGVEMWKRRQRQRDLARRRRAPGSRRARSSRRSPPRSHELGLPHPVHVHCNNLGVAGNCRTTLDTLRTLEGRRAHLAHLQFHAYGGEPGGRPRSRAPELAEYLERAPGAQRRRRAGDVRPGDDDDRRRAGLRGPARDHPRPLGQRATPRPRPAAGSSRSPTASATTSTRCSGASASSCSCSAATRGGSCCRPITPTAARSSATRA